MTYQVKAVQWSGGWELHIEGEGVTQVDALDDARTQVVSYLETMHERDFSEAVVNVTLA